MVHDVRSQKQLRLRATGANFDEDEAYRLLYNLVDSYNTSSLKLAFLKPHEKDDHRPASSPIGRHQTTLKRKQSVSLAREAGLTGQPLALQRHRDRQHASTSQDSQDDEDQDGTGETDDGSSTHTSPAQKRRRMLQMQISDTLVKGVNRLIDLHAATFVHGSQQNHGTSQSSDQEVAAIRSQVSQLQTEVTGINQEVSGISSKIDMVLRMLMQSEIREPFR